MCIPLVSRIQFKLYIFELHHPQGFAAERGDELIQRFTGCTVPQRFVELRVRGRELDAVGGAVSEVFECCDLWCHVVLSPRVLLGAGACRAARSRSSGPGAVCSGAMVPLWV